MVKRTMLLAAALISLLALSGPMMAQSNEIILRINLGASVNEDVFKGFYDAHPGVKIVQLTNMLDMSYGGKTIYDIEAILDKEETYYRHADVIRVSMATLTTFATHAGYVLDMTPYLEADTKTRDDFYPVALKMYAWDKGIWGLPMGLLPWFMTYDAAAFDAAGSPHPSPSWLLDDYLAAGRALAVKDKDGNVQTAGLFTTDYGVLVRPVLGIRFYNNNNQPALSTPEIEDTITKLLAYNEEMSTTSFNKLALQMGGVVNVTSSNGNPSYTPVPTSGNQVLVAGDGLAISAGTQHPDLAYALVAYLTGNPEVVSHFPFEVLARRSLQDQPIEGFEPPVLTDEMKTLLPDILEHGVPTSELRYSEYLYGLYDMMHRNPDKPLTLHETLQALQQAAVDNLKVADARRSQPITVATPDQ